MLLDADLAVLGSEPAAYQAYVTGVRAEYGHVDDAAWATGRAAVLRGLLDRPAPVLHGRGREAVGGPGAGEHGRRAGVVGLTRARQRQCSTGERDSRDRRTSWSHGLAGHGTTSAASGTAALAALKAKTSTEISVRVFGRDAKTGS